MKPTSKRARRRDRGHQRASRREVDRLRRLELNKKMIARLEWDFMLAMASWSGTRCPACGKPIEPWQLVSLSSVGRGICVDGAIANHDGPCVERDWQGDFYG
jgi:hypothetical protein